MSMSNRARRMAEHHSRHHADAELNLIPLIDILSVMVAFLLVYSTEVEVIQNTKGIEMPQSIAESHAARVGRGDDHARTISSCRASASRASPTSTRQHGTIIAPLRDALKRPHAGRRASRERDLASREITVLGDKSLPYDVLKKVMATCTDADYGRISLAVIQKEKPVPAGGFRPA